MSKIPCDEGLPRLFFSRLMEIYKKKYPKTLSYTIYHDAHCFPNKKYHRMGLIHLPENRSGIHS